MTLSHKGLLRVQFYGFQFLNNLRLLINAVLGDHLLNFHLIL